MLELWQAGAADVYIKRHFPNLVSSAKLIHDVDLSLVHTNFFVDYPKLVAPNTKYVGGMNLGEGRPLEGKFREFVEGAKKGVVLFSLGYTGFKTKNVPGFVVSAFIEAFAKLDQRVIMRFDPNLVEAIPQNVLIVPWFPQHDLLAHPKTVLFVTHCGMTGILEAVYHSVPMLALPIFGDQPDNAARLVERGLALKVDRSGLCVVPKMHIIDFPIPRHTLTEREVTKALLELLGNPQYLAQVSR